MKLSKLIVLTATALFVTSMAVAHPGHGNEGQHVLEHHLVQPTHFVPLLIVMIVGFGIYKYRSRMAALRKNQ